MDAAILTSGASRWYNFYVEGINWLVRNIPIDGLYLDDVAYDRTILKRVRKVLDRARPGCLIDLHSNTLILERAGQSIHRVLPLREPALVRRGLQLRRHVSRAMARRVQRHSRSG